MPIAAINYTFYFLKRAGTKPGTMDKFPSPDINNLNIT
jgi:hypothetical protein